MVHMYMQYQIKGTILVKFTRARKIDHVTRKLSIIVKMYQQNIHLFFTNWIFFISRNLKIINLHILSFLSHNYEK